MLCAIKLRDHCIKTALQFLNLFYQSITNTSWREIHIRKNVHGIKDLLSFTHWSRKENKVEGKFLHDRFCLKNLPSLLIFLTNIFKNLLPKEIVFFGMDIYCLSQKIQYNNHESFWSKTIWKEKWRELKHNIRTILALKKMRVDLI